jgi:hypothetical protein
VIDAAFYLHMDELLRRLAAGMISQLNKEETNSLIKESRKSNLLK